MTTTTTITITTASMADATTISFDFTRPIFWIYSRSGLTKSRPLETVGVGMFIG